MHDPDVHACRKSSLTPASHNVVMVIAAVLYVSISCTYALLTGKTKTMYTDEKG